MMRPLGVPAAKHLVLPLVLCAAGVGGAPLAREIPFSAERGQIVIPVVVGGSAPLSVALDTGMTDGLLLYENKVAEFGIRNAIEVDVPGAGAGPPSKAMLADSMTFRSGDVEFANQRIIFLTSETMKGFRGDGVIGHSVFGGYAIEVDHERSVLRLHDPGYTPDSTWTLFPIGFKGHTVPWLGATVSILTGDDVPISVYIDLASREPLELLLRDEMKFSPPESLEETYLGRGLSGDIYGYTGRIAALKLGPYELRTLTCVFVDAKVRSKQPNADGVLGYGALKHFDMIFDYQRERLYLRPNAAFPD